MSLIPLLFSDWWEDLEYPHHLTDQHFGQALHPEQLPKKNSYWTHVINAMPHRRRWDFRSVVEMLLQQRRESNGRSMTPLQPIEKDDFQTVLDVQQFEPHEIEVKVVDNCVVITGKHEDKQDEHGWVSREFSRRYLLPEEFNIEQLTSRLSSDGLLTVVAPKKRPLKYESVERKIQIEHTGKPFENKSLEKPKKIKEGDK